MPRDTVQELQENIAQAKKIVDFAAALERLRSNPDFRRVICDGYLRDEAVRLVHLKADPAMQTAERQGNLVKQIDGIGSLLDYFRTVEFAARTALKAIEADEATIEEVLAEEAQ